MLKWFCFGIITCFCTLAQFGPIAEVGAQQKTGCILLYPQGTNVFSVDDEVSVIAGWTGVPPNDGWSIEVWVINTDPPQGPGPWIGDHTVGIITANGTTTFPAITLPRSGWYRISIALINDDGNVVDTDSVDVYCGP